VPYRHKSAELRVTAAAPAIIRHVRPKQTTFANGVAITVWVLLIWISRLPFVGFGFNYWSYLVYFSFATALSLYALRVTTKSHALPFISNPWLWAFGLAVIVGGASGLQRIDEIPPWILTKEADDYSVPWIYVRNVIFPSLLLPVSTVLVAAAVVDKQRLNSIVVPLVAFVVAFATSIVVYVAMSSESLFSMAQETERSNHLVALGFHSNELGALLACGYGLTLGLQSKWQPGIYGRLIRVAPMLAAVGLMFTFSRGAYVAFVLVNLAYFVRKSLQQKLILAMALVMAMLFMPSVIRERISFGIGTGDLNFISAGRVENIWQPLLPDVMGHLAFGQGLQSIMWTDAQQQQLIFPVSIVHNGYLELLLDLGIFGSIPILAWYFYLLWQFSKQTREDPDAEYRAFFAGCALAMVALFAAAITSDRFTPTASNSMIWIGAGVLLGRRISLCSKPRQSAASIRR
jgi:O-antigen ligase